MNTDTMQDEAMKDSLFLLNFIDYLSNFSVKNCKGQTKTGHQCPTDNPSIQDVEAESNHLMQHDLRLAQDTFDLSFFKQTNKIK